MEHFKLITKAYETLKDQGSRNIYNAENPTSSSSFSHSRYSRPNPSYSQSTYTKWSTKKPLNTEVNKEYFNEELWRAWHYGDNATNSPSVTFTKAQVSSPHAEYFHKRNRRMQERMNESREQEEQENNSSRISAVARAQQEASENLRRQREERRNRRKNEKDEREVCVIS